MFIYNLGIKTSLTRTIQRYKYRMKGSEGKTWVKICRKRKTV